MSKIPNYEKATNAAYMVAQIENDSCIRVEGARTLAFIASDIEDMLNSVLKENCITVKDGDAA